MTDATTRSLSTNGALHVTGAATNLTQAEFDALSLSASDAGKEYRITDGVNAGKIYVYTGVGTTFDTLQTNGSAHVNIVPGSGSTSKNRLAVNINLASDVQTIHWPANSNITYITVTAVLHQGETLANDEYVVFTVDAADDTDADTKIGTTGDIPASLVADVSCDIVPLNTIVAQPQAVALSGGTNSGGRLDFRVLGSSALDVHIGAS